MKTLGARRHLRHTTNSCLPSYLSAELVYIISVGAYYFHRGLVAMFADSYLNAVIEQAPLL